MLNGSNNEVSFNVDTADNSTLYDVDKSSPFSKSEALPSDVDILPQR